MIWTVCFELTGISDRLAHPQIRILQDTGGGHKMMMFSDEPESFGARLNQKPFSKYGKYSPLDSSPSEYPSDSNLCALHVWRNGCKFPKISRPYLQVRGLSLVSDKSSFSSFHLI